LANVRLVSYAPQHRQLVRTWLARDHVRRWWGEPGENLSQIDSWGGEATLIEADGRPVGMVLWEHPTRRELDDAGLYDVPTTVVDLDIMIGEQDAVGVGVGTTALKLAVKRILETYEDAPSVMAGTSVSNAASIGALSNAGFQIDREFDDPIGGRFYLFFYDRTRGAPGLPDDRAPENTQ